MTDQPNQPKYDLQHLQNYLALTALLTGNKLTELEVTPDFYTWYVQNVQHNADVLGLNPGFRGDTPSFMNVKLIKKVKLDLK